MLSLLRKVYSIQFNRNRFTTMQGGFKNRWKIKKIGVYGKSLHERQT